MGSMTRRGFLALVVLGVAALAPGGCGGDKPQSIKVVIADYSKDHTRPFWQALAETYTKQTGRQGRPAGDRLELHRPAGQHDDPEQPAARRPEPQRVRQLRQGRPALHGRGDPVAQDAGRLPRRLRAGRRLSRQAVRLPDPGQRARVLLQPGRCSPRPAWPGRRGPGTSSCRPRSKIQALGGGDHRLRAAARAGGGAGRVVDLDVEQRRRLEGRRGVDDRQRARTCRRCSSWPTSPTSTR